MKVNFQTLCAAVERERDAVLDAIDYNLGVPLNGKWGSVAQTKIVCKGLYRLIMARGQLDFHGLVIGVSPSTSNLGGLRATDQRGLRVVVRKLREKVMAQFETMLKKRWETVKIAQGMHNSAETSEAEKFANQTFRGFD